MSEPCEKLSRFLSEAVADNAATLHAFANPSCAGIRGYHCPEHDCWHIGHASRIDGDACKAADESRLRRDIRPAKRPAPKFKPGYRGRR